MLQYLPGKKSKLKEKEENEGEARENRTGYVWDDAEYWAPLASDGQGPSATDMDRVSANKKPHGRRRSVWIRGKNAT